MKLISKRLYLSGTKIFDAKKNGTINFFSSLFTTIFIFNFWSIPTQAEGSKFVKFGNNDIGLNSHPYSGAENPIKIPFNNNFEKADFAFDNSSTTSTNKLNCPANYKEVSFNWATSSTANDGLVWTDPTENKYNVNGNLITATLEKNASRSSVENGSVFLGAFPPPGGGLTWNMDNPDNTNTQSPRFIVKFAYPVPVSEFVIADVDANASGSTTSWHDQVKVTTLGPSNPTVNLVPDDTSIITVSPSGDTVYAADGVGKVNNGTKDGNVTTKITGLIDTIIIDYQDGKRSKSDPGQHGIGIGSFTACYPKVDYGDAPDNGSDTGSGNYQTLPTNDGPIHLIVSNLQIGTAPDDDNGTLQNADANADDNTDTNDEQGITFTTLSINSQSYKIEDISVTNNTSNNANLVGWIDFDGNGSFDSDEATTVPVNSQVGTQTVDLQWSNIPNDIKPGTTYARFRLTTDSSIATGDAATSLSTGAADDGEVEDYKLEITEALAANPNVILVKRITRLNQTDYINVVDGLDNGNTQSSNYVPSPKDAEDNHPNWISNFLKGEIAGIKVQPNDQLEYTIYYLSTGDTEAKSVLICDRVPQSVSFIPNSFNSEPNRATGGLQNTDRGIQWLKDGNTESLTNIADGDLAQYFPAGVEPSTVYPKIDCDGDPDVNLPNTNGAVVVNLGELPNATDPGTPNTSYGYIRFRGKVK